jgi:3-dehydroquinate synthase
MSKTIPVFGECLEALAQAQLTRGDAIIGFGGGAVTDLAGYLASSYLRGIKFINVPTTILAQVDASVGGKTGINLRGGKNLCGAFYEPAGVYCDTTVLETLPVREYREGFGEIVKMGLVFDHEILRLIESDKVKHLPEIIYRAVQQKAQVVEQDFKETGLRMFLNYGHTMGHAIEKLEHFSWRHGEAVAVGMIYAGELAVRLGLMEQSLLDRHYQILEALELPTTWSTTSTFAEVLEVMKRDKKATSDAVRFVILRDIEQPEIVAVSDISLLSEVFARITINKARPSRRSAACLQTSGKTR